MMKSLAAVLVLLALSGCVLQSKSPLYADSAASLVFGDKARVAEVFSKKDGAWVSENERITLAPEGRHYVVTMKDSVLAVAFIPLEGSWHVLQATEAGKPTVYLLAKVSEHGADTRALACGDLKKDAGLAAWIDHQGDDRFVAEGAPLDKMFMAALAMPGEAETRLTLTP